MKPQTSSSGSDIGILGGGQLSRMLVQAAQRQGLSVHALVESEKSSAARLGKKSNVKFSLGEVREDLDSLGALSDFLESCSVVTFENEFVDCRVLAAVSMELGTKFVPQISVLMRLQDKLLQKETFTQLGLTSAAYQVIDEAHAAESIRAAFQRFQKGLVLKWAKFGYDGYGNKVFRPGASHEGALEFCEKAWRKGSRVYAEEFIPFQRELAITACHSLSGDLIYYPLVVTEQKNGACHRVSGPATSLGVASGLEKEAQTAAEKLARRFPLHGVFSIEFFETVDHRLILNELAPRVHNSAHYSIDTCDISQFENHLKAVQGQALSPVQASPFFFMLNLLAPRPTQSSPLAQLAAVPATAPAGVPDFAHLHWYDKDRFTPGRKMGHLSFSAATIEELNQKIQICMQWENQWLEKVLK